MFGAGPIPSSGTSGIVDLGTFGTGSLTAFNDLNLTLNQLRLNSYSTGVLTVGSANSGNFAFAGAAQVQQAGSGANTVLSAGLTVGSTATGLTFTGPGGSGTTVSGTIASNTATGALLKISTTGPASTAGIVTLAASNSFAGGVQLESGTLSVTNARGLGIFGTSRNTVTVNGGYFSTTQTLVNNFTLNSDLVIAGTSNSGTLAGTLSGAGGVQVRSSGSGIIQTFTGSNSYGGATTIGGIVDAPAGTSNQAGVFRLAGAVGSILSSSAINVRDGGTFEINKSLGDSLGNTRVNPATTLTSTSGFVQVSGSTGFTAQALPTVQARGLTTISAVTQTGVSTLLTIPNLQRLNAGTLTFTGTNLGNAVAAVGVNNANIVLTLINGAAPSAVLVGPGSAGSADAGIIPWALGDTSNTASNFGAGTGFITYGPDGVRLLDTGSEYADVAGGGSLSAGNNNRVTGSPLAQDGNITLNSLFNTGAFDLTGTGTLSLTSGALAGLSSFSIANPLSASELIVSTIGGLGSPTTLTFNGAVTATTLTKSGHGTLITNGSGSTLSGNLISVNAGFVQVDDVTKLGIANLNTSTLRFSMHSFASQGGLIYSGSGSQTLNVQLDLQSGRTAINVAQSSGQLTLAGPIDGTGGINYSGAGTVAVTGAKTYAGGTRLTGGRLIIDGDSVFGDPSAAFSINAANGTLTLAGNWTSSRQIILDGPLGTPGSVDGFDTAGFNATWNGPIVGSGNITKVDTSATPGIWLLTSASSSYTGTIQLGNNASITVAGGTLALSGAGALNSASIKFGPDAAGAIGTYVLDLSAATGTSWRGFAQLTTGTGFTQAHIVQLGLTTMTPVDLRIGAGTFGGTAGVIQGFGNVVKTGTGTLVLQSANTFTGNVEVWGGVLSISSDSQLGNTSNSIAIKGGTLVNTAVLTTARGVLLGPTISPLNGAIANTIRADAALILNGAVGNAVSGVPGGFEKIGSADLTLAGSNTFTGSVRLTTGSLSIAADNNLGIGGALILNGGTLTTTATTAINRRMSITAASNIAVAATTTLTLNGTMIGSGNLAIGGAGSVVLNNPSPYYTGNLTIGSATLAGANLRQASLTVSTALDSSDLSREFGSISLVGNMQLGNSGRAVVGFNNADQTWSGNVLGLGSASVIKLGTGALTFSGSGNSFAGGYQSYSGRTNLSGNGTLPLQASLAIGAWGDLNNRGASLRLDNSGTANFNRLADTQIVAINNIDLLFQGNATPGTETAGVLKATGYNIVTMQTGSTLQFTDSTAGLVRVDHGTFLFRGGSTMGKAVASASVSNLKFTNLAADLVGTGTGTQLPVLPYAVGASSVSGTGNTFVTYGTNGISALLTTGSEYATNITTSTINDNVRINNATLTQVTLTSNAVARSLILTGGADSTNRIASSTTQTLTIDAGLILTPVNQVYTVMDGHTGVVLGIQTAQLLTGLGNTRELNIFTAGIAGTGNLAIGAAISTTGSLTKSGLSDLFLTNNANSYTGGTTINGGNLVIDSLGAVNNFAGGLTLAGGYLKYRGPNTSITSTVLLAGGSSTTAGSTGGIHVPSGSSLSIGAGQLTGFGGLMKEGTGTLVISGAQSYSGATLLQAGTLAIDGTASLGTNSRVVFLESSLSSASGATLRFDAPMTLNQEFITNTSSATVGFRFDTNGNNVTLAGLIASKVSSRGLIKVGAGTLTLTAENSYSGATQVFGGTLALAGTEGSILATTGAGGLVSTATIVINAGGRLTLDNTTANNSNRLPDLFSMPIDGNSLTAGGILLSGGELLLRGNASTSSGEVTGTMMITAGTVTLQNNGRNVTLTTGLVQANSTGSVGLIRGDNLGSPVSLDSTNWFAIDMGGGAVQLGGAGGAIATPFVNTLPGFMGSTNSTGIGSELITYDPAVGFRLLTASEYTTAIPTANFASSRAPNLGLASATTAPSTTSWASAIKLSAGASLGGTATMTLVNGTVLATGNSSISLPSLGLSSSSVGYGFLTPGSGTTLTVNSRLSGDALSKYGDGTLELSNAHTGSGQVYIGQGTLRLVGANAALNPLGGTVIVATGATLELGSADRTISRLGTTSNIGSFQSGIAQDGTINLGSGTLTLYDTTTTMFTGSITGTGGLNLSYSNRHVAQIQTLTQASNYTGVTTIRNGTLQLASAGTLLNTSRIDVPGGTLVLENSDDAVVPGGYIAQRVSSSTPINLAGGLTITANANAVQNIAFGAVNLIGGATITATPSTSAPTTVTIADLTRAASRGTLSLAGNNANFGLTPSSAGNSRVQVTAIDGAAPSAALVGGGGAVNSPTISILPWAFATSAASFMTIGPDGLRPLSTLEYAITLPIGQTNNNVFLSAAVTLNAGNYEVNSLLKSGTGSISTMASVTSTVTLRSGALSFTGNTTMSPGTGAALNLNFGTSNNREGVIFNSSTVTINATISTTGGLTKYGVGTLTLGGNNTFTGGLTINQGIVAFNSDTRLGAAGGAIRIAAPGGGTVNGLTYNATGTAFLNFTRPIMIGSIGTLSGSANNIWQLNGDISGAGAIAYTIANSIFELVGSKSYTGATDWDNGHLSISSDASLGIGGELRLDAASTQVLILRNNWTTDRLIHSIAAGGIQTNGHDAVWNGQLIGSSTLTKSGQGSLTLTAANPFSGILSITAGSFILKDRGSLAIAGTQNIFAGASLVLDDSGIHQSDRLPDFSATLTLTSAHLQLKGSSTNLTEELINSISLAGASTITVESGAGQAAILQLTGTLTQSATAVTLFRGNNLGINAPGSANSANLLLFDPLNSAAILSGGGGPAGTSTVSTIRGSFGDNSPAGSGIQLVTYDSANGVRLLTAAEYASTLVNGTVMADNIRVSSAASITDPTTINALWLSGGSISGGGTLTISAGTILVSGTGNVLNTTVSVGAAALAIGGPGDLTISTTIPVTQTGGLVKTGAGTLTLAMFNSHTGGTILNGGTLILGDNSALGTGMTATLTVLEGTIAGNGTPITITNSVTVSGRMTVGGSSDITFGSPSSFFVLPNAARTITVTNTATSTIAGVITGSAMPGMGLVKEGPGLLVLTNANTYGPNLNGQYYLSTTTVNAGNLRVNNTSGSGTGGSIVVVNSGGTLSGMGTIIPSQSLQSRNTVTINAGGTLAPGNGSPGTLTVGSATTLATVEMLAGSRYLFTYTGTPSTALFNSGTSLTAGVGNPLLLVNGALNIDSGATIVIVGNAADFTGDNYSFRIGTATTVNPLSISSPGQFDTTQFTGYGGGFSFLLQNVGGNVYLNVATPEPPAALLISFLALGCVCFIRHRRKRAFSTC